MTYDPNRDAPAPGEINERPLRRANDFMNIGVTLAILVVLALGGLIWYGMSNMTVATDDRPTVQRPATTTGGPALPRDAGTNNPPAAQRPAPASK